VRGEVADVAFRLFGERGFDAVSVDDICRASGISRATFFRYFAGKEDAVVSAMESYGEAIVTALSARPEPEPWEAVHRAVRSAVEAAPDPEGAKSRLRLAVSTPALRARQLEKQARERDALAAAIAVRRGAGPDELASRALAAAALAALDVALTYWLAHPGGVPALLRAIDAAFAALTPATTRAD
jgi:AcrR family transcriptional regulator